MIERRIHRLRLFLAFAYFAIWFIFGLLYQHAANRSHGDAFVFQNDILVASQVKAFQKEKRQSVPSQVVRRIIEKGVHSTVALNVKHNDDVPSYLFTNKAIGNDWGHYYAVILQAGGTTHYSTDVQAEETTPLFSLSKVIGGLDSLEFPAKRCFKVRLHLYKGTPDIVPDQKRKSEYVRVKSETVWLDIVPSPLIIENTQYDLIPISMLAELLAHSTNYLDDSLYKLQSILRGDHRYPLLDFLYFSAVTITTLGYGDILPNSSYVRFLVMCEAMLGLIVIGAFVSTLITPDRGSAV